MTTLAEWAHALLQAGGLVDDDGAVTAVVAWAAAEGSSAAWNPLDTTEPWEGATDYNSAGVKNYPDQAGGIAATLATLRNGLYGPVLTALSTSPVDAYAVARAVGETPWGTGNFSAVVAVVGAHPAAYGDHDVAGSSGAPAPDPPATPPTRGTSKEEDMAITVLPDGRRTYDRAAPDGHSLVFTEKSAGSNTWSVIDVTDQIKADPDNSAATEYLVTP